MPTLSVKRNREPAANETSSKALNGAREKQRADMGEVDEAIGHVTFGIVVVAGSRYAPAASSMKRVAGEISDGTHRSSFYSSVRAR